MSELDKTNAKLEKVIIEPTESSERLEIPGDSKINIPDNLAELVSK